MHYLIALTFLLTPAYALRFNILGFPANLLMLWVVFLWIIFFTNLIVKKRLADFLQFLENLDKKIVILTGLFLLAGFISLFVKGFDRQKLGQFIVLFLQPISIFFITQYIIARFPNTKYYILHTIYLLLAVMGIYALIQYFTLLGLPVAWWGNNEEPRRALGFFGHPNFYALFAAPLLALLIPDVAQDIGLLTKQHTRLHYTKPLTKVALWAIGVIGLFFSLSRAGWLGLAAAIGVYLIVAADKKIRRLASVILILIVIVIAAVPNFRYRVLLPFYGEKSTVSRFSLWDTGWKSIKESPITGLGLTGFAQAWPRLNTDPGLASASHNFPHNIFLDLWVETGLLGLISLMGLMGLYTYRGLCRSNVVQVPGLPTKQGTALHYTADESTNYKLAIALFIIALLFQGLIDNPYFKNDLAMVFWIILSLI